MYMSENPERGWDSRFTLEQIPEYNALNDRYCKFWKKKQKGKLRPGNDWQSQTAPAAYGQTPSPAQQAYDQMGRMPFAKPMMAFQTMTPTAANPIGMSPLSTDTQPVDRMAATQPAKRYSLDHTLATLPAENVQPTRPPPTMTANDLRRPHRMARASQGNSSAPVESTPLAAASVNQQTAVPQAPQGNMNMIDSHEMLERRGQQLAIEKAIEVREGFLYLLQELVERTQGQAGLDREQVLKEMTGILSSLRNSTLDCVEVIGGWEAQTGSAYLWKGVGYLSKLQTDLHFFASSRAAQLLDYSVIGNPLLVRSDVSRKGQGGMLPPVSGKGKEHMLKNDPLGERMAHAEKLLKKAAADVSDEVEEEGYLAILEEDDVRDPDDEGEVPEEDWLARTEDRTKEVEHKAALDIQRAYRGFRDRRRAKYLKRQRLAAIRLQKFARVVRAKKEAWKMRQRRLAAIQLQSFQRGILDRERVRNLRVEKYAATEIQRSFRGHFARKFASYKSYERYSARVIQQNWRGYATRRACRIQRESREYVAAVLMQKAWRGYAIRSDPRYCKTNLVAVITLQAWGRGINARSVATQRRKMRTAVTIIQAFYRGCKGRARCTSMRAALRVDHSDHLCTQVDVSASKIQAGWRGHTARKQCAEKRAKQQENVSAQVLEAQRAAAREEVEAQFVAKDTLDAAATRIQCMVRVAFAHKRVHAVRGLNSTAITIQRAERGRQGRKKAAAVRTTRGPRERTPPVSATQLLQTEQTEPENSSPALGSPDKVSTRVSFDAKTNDTPTNYEVDATLRKCESMFAEDEDEGEFTLYGHDSISAVMTSGTQQPRPIRSSSVDSGPQSPASILTPSCVLTPEANFLAAPKVPSEAACIQRGWRCKAARTKHSTRSECRRVIGKRDERAALLQEKRFAQTTLCRLFAVIDARNAVSARRAKRDIAVQQSRTQALLQERLAATVTLQKWVKGQLHMKREYSKRVAIREAAALRTRTASRQQERTAAVCTLQRTERCRSARCSVRHHLYLRDKSRRYEEMLARKQEEQALEQLKHLDQKAQINFVQSEAAIRTNLADQMLGELCISFEALRNTITMINAMQQQEDETALSSTVQEHQEEDALPEEAEPAAPAPLIEDLSPPEVEVIEQEEPVPVPPLKQMEDPSTKQEDGDALRCLFAIADESLAHLTALRRFVEDDASLVDPSAEVPSRTVTPGSPRTPRVALQCLLDVADAKLTFLLMLKQFVDEDEEILSALTSMEPYAKDNSNLAALMCLLNADDGLESLDVLSSCLGNSPRGSEQRTLESVDPPKSSTSLRLVPVKPEVETEMMTEELTPQQSDFERAVEEQTRKRMVEMEERLEAMQRRLEAVEKEGRPSPAAGPAEELPRESTPAKETAAAVVEAPFAVSPVVSRSPRPEFLDEPMPAMQPSEAADDETLLVSEDDVAGIAGLQDVENDIAEGVRLAAEADTARILSEQRRLEERAAAAAVHQEKISHANAAAEDSAATTIQCKYRQLQAQAAMARRREEVRAEELAELRAEEEVCEESAAVAIQRVWIVKAERLAATRIRAVTRIQALLRGRRGRAEAKRRRVQFNEANMVTMMVTPTASPASTAEPSTPTPASSPSPSPSPTPTHTAEVLPMTPPLAPSAPTQEEQAAEVIQRSVRSHNARCEASWRKEREREKREAVAQEVSAVSIQNEWRAHQARGEVARKRQSIKTHKELNLERERQREEAERSAEAMNRFVEQQRLEDEVLHLAAETVQRCYKCYNARFMLRWKRRDRNERRAREQQHEIDSLEGNAATRIQCMYRVWKARKVQAQQRTRKETSRAIKCAEEERLEIAATKIQCAYRCFNARFEAAWRRERSEALNNAHNARKLQARKEAAILQARLDAQKLKENKMEAAALVVQCAWRTYNARFQKTWMQERKERRIQDQLDEAERTKAACVLQVWQFLCYTSHYTTYSAEPAAFRHGLNATRGKSNATCTTKAYRRRRRRRCSRRRSRLPALFSVWRGHARPVSPRVCCVRYVPRLEGRE